jgi:outer membrane biosynthesis protein TonB
MSIHDTLRSALNDAIVEPDIDENAVTEQILGRLNGGSGEGPGDGGGGAGGGFSGLAGAVPLWAATAGSGAMGLLVALAVVNPLTGGGAIESPAIRGALESVPIYACPGSGEVGSLRRGDRAFIIGQADGFVAVRNLRGDGATVYVAREHVTPDADISDLPVMDCAQSGTATGLQSTAEPSPEPQPTVDPDQEQEPEQEPGPVPNEPAPNPAPGPAPQPAPQPKPGPEPDPDPEPEPEPQDTAGPVFGNVYGSPETVGQVNSDCDPEASTITANVTDNIGVTTVTARWTLPTGTVTKSMSASGTNNYTVTFSVPAGTYTGGTSQASVPVEVTAKDAAGNTTTNNDLTMSVDWGCPI